MENTEEKLIPDDPKNVLTIDDIPPELILQIFGCLTRMELIAAQCVCRTWRTMAHDKSLWKDYTFIVSGTPEDERRLTVMPALQNIDGHADNNFMNIILDHVTNLNKMNCKYKPPISFVQVQSLVQKYPKLKSITLDACAPDVLQSVQVLQTSEELEELILQKQKPCVSSFGSRCDCSSLSKLIDILNIFADPGNFPDLSNLDLSGVVYNGVFGNSSFSNAYTRVLTNKSHQLQSLKLNVDYSVDVGIVNALNMCSRIQNLHLVFCRKCPAIIDISRMSQLRSLKVHMLKNDADFLTALYSSFSRNTWGSLTEIDLTFHGACKTDVLGVLTKNARQLKKLHYWLFDDYINECQLEHVGNLSKLESLSLSYFVNISKEGITYISPCYNLKYLRLSAFSANITDLNPCIAYMIQSMKQLESICFTAYSLAYVDLEDKEEIKSFVSQYGINN